MPYICLPKGDFVICKRKKNQMFLTFFMKPAKKMNKKLIVFSYAMNRKVDISILFLYLSVYKESACTLMGQGKGKRLLNY